MSILYYDLTPMKQTPIIAPSILSANFAHLARDVRRVVDAGAEFIHVDVMDNHYVPNLTFGPIICDALRKDGITATMDVHLMISPVDDIIPAFAKAGADYITFHPEATSHVDRTLQLIKSHGCKAGIVLNPATPLSYLDHILDQLDMVLLMSVNPGFGGQSFIPYVLDKVREVRSRIDALGKPIRLEIDGGVNLNNIKAVSDAGVDTFVMGSAIFGSADPTETVRSALTLLQ